MSPTLGHAVALAALTLIVVQIVLRLPIGASVSAITGPSLRSIAVLRARGISEHWKERAMLLYARRTMAGVGRFGLCLAVLGVVALGIGAALARLLPGFADFALGWGGLGLTLVVATAWLSVRARLVPAATTSDYSPGEQFLHRLALGNKTVAELAFRLDQQIAAPDAAQVAEGAHVFVLGLARAGTTILTRRLHETGAFGSLTYRDMPFALAPNLWRRVAGRGRRVAAQERAHGDGLVVDLDSAEALEEPFWRVFDGHAYIKADRLLTHAPKAGLVAQYLRYVGAILRARGASRYLAKNNNNILRLGALAEAMPNAAFLVVFRDPLTHATSLLAQHRRFRARHRADPFEREYMGWLAHHEFGSDHRPFAFAQGRDGDTDTLDYWLTQWIAVYGHLSGTLPPNARLVCYEDLCNDPAAWPALARDLGVSAQGKEAFRPAPPPERQGLSEAGHQAVALYDALRQRT